MTAHPVKKIFSRYDLGEVKSVSDVSIGYSNVNYRVETEKGIFLYRLCKQQGPEHIRREIDMLNALAEIRFPAAYPIRRKDGLYINPTDKGPVVVFQFIPGREPDVNPETAAEAARAAARLNSFPDWRPFRLKNKLNIENCIRFIDVFESAPNQHPELFDYFIEQTEYLREPMEVPAPEGLIHGDLFPDNTIFRGNRLAAVIDFEDSCTDKLVYDVGMTINGFCFPGNRLNLDLLAIFITAYTRIRPLSRLEYELLPCYMQMGAHVMIYWHLKYDLLNRPNERQLIRVHELMNRVKAMRETRLPDLEHLV